MGRTTSLDGRPHPPTLRPPIHVVRPIGGAHAG